MDDDDDNNSTGSTGSAFSFVANSPPRKKYKMSIKQAKAKNVDDSTKIAEMKAKYQSLAADWYSGYGFAI